MRSRVRHNNHYCVVVRTPSLYTIIIIAFDRTTKLFTLHAYQEIIPNHGEFGSYFFINHTYFFNAISEHIVKNNTQRYSIALLFKEPFITQKPPPLIPSLFQDTYYITHPLLFQCAIIPPLHKLMIDMVTHIDTAYQVAIDFTQHTYDEYSFYRLCTKKSDDLVSLPHHYNNVIAACGAYLMEKV